MGDRKIRVVSTKRNKYLEPMAVGDRFVIGYDEEIHYEDSIEFFYKLPLGAIKRLIRSYYEYIQMYDEENVYFATLSSSGMRGRPYCYRMINDLIKQLNKHGLNGEKIDDEVFARYFKEDYEKLKRFDKNHSDQGINDPFGRCNDPECCKPLSKREKLVQLLRILYFKPKWWFWECKQLLKNFKSHIQKYLKGGVFND